MNLLRKARGKKVFQKAAGIVLRSSGMKHKPVSGRDFAAALQEQAEVTHKVTIRYNPAVKASMRVLYGERALTILHIIDNWELHHEMVLMCREVL